MIIGCRGTLKAVPSSEQWQFVCVLVAAAAAVVLGEEGEEEEEDGRKADSRDGNAG